MNDEHKRFWETKSLEELAAEQGVAPIEDLDEVFGRASELWDDNDDFDRFLAATAGGEEA